MKSKNGVAYYTKGKAAITVNFPEEDVSCANCILCQEVRGTIPKYYCIAQRGERIFYPENGIDPDCPLEFEGGKQNG